MMTLTSSGLEQLFKGNLSEKVMKGNVSVSCGIISKTDREQLVQSLSMHLVFYK